LTERLEASMLGRIHQPFASRRHGADKKLNLTKQADAEQLMMRAGHRGLENQRHANPERCRRQSFVDPAAAWIIRSVVKQTRLDADAIK
jgi:hypothetical protein